MNIRLKQSLPVTALMSARMITLSGQVQGVGFRPFIYRLAKQHSLTGWVRNCLGIVEIHVQGLEENIENFSSDIFDKKPALAKPVLESNVGIKKIPLDFFSILDSKNQTNKQVGKQNNSQVSVPTDLFLCNDCLTELNDPDNRRYHYPFINCTQCGPRYTIIQQLPYDRADTTMAEFELCSHCKAEYLDVNNRRFHAEPIACPTCGPSLEFHYGEIKIKGNDASLKKAIDTLRRGKTVAVKGIGGYHLMCDATNSSAVKQLRVNKSRPEKPLAVLFPSPIEQPFQFTEQSVYLTENDKAFLLQAERPILLVKKNTQTNLAEEISPNLNEVGIMLPYSPLHHLLLDMFAGPLVATSANISGEPVLTNNQDIEKRLSHIADAYLHHNRPIQRPADDPVYRTIDNKPRIIRTGRGSAPTEITLPFTLEHPVLAVGAHMKNTITLAWGNRAIISPHIGEMNSLRSLHVFENTINDLQKLYSVTAETIICDAHPGYNSTHWAKKQNIPVHRVYHHHAHASSAFFECPTTNPIILFAWDGVGYGDDKTLWGGETFMGTPGKWQRVASMRPFHLPGADKAGRQPWRSASALCWETGLNYEGAPEQDPLLRQAWQRKINSPQSSSVGRLFDGAAALMNVCTQASFEGQGPMQLEALAEQYIDKNNLHLNATDSNYIKLNIETKNNLFITDWAPLMPVLMDSNLSISQRAYLFHLSMANNILQQAIKIRENNNVNIVSFSGGVFQNRVLTECAMSLLSENGFQVSLPELIPVNDAGISFGQVIEYAYTT